MRLRWLGRWVDWHVHLRRTRLVVLKLGEKLTSSFFFIVASRWCRCESRRCRCEIYPVRLVSTLPSLHVADWHRRDGSTGEEETWARNAYAILNTLYSHIRVFFRNCLVARYIQAYRSDGMSYKSGGFDSPSSCTGWMEFWLGLFLIYLISGTCYRKGILLNIQCSIFISRIFVDTIYILSLHRCLADFWKHLIPKQATGFNDSRN